MITNPDIQYKIIPPGPSLSPFVESFWMLANEGDQEHDIVILPDGRFDIIFSYSANSSYQVMQMGLGTEPERQAIPAKTRMTAISFKLLAMEYLLEMKAAFLLNKARCLPDDFWGVTKNDLEDMDVFCQKVSAKMYTLIQHNIDSRKQQLFELIYASQGTLPVKLLSEKVFWTSRQINRYFTERFGLSLKAYCNIIRFRASLPHIRKGKLFPELNFTDQNHFIKEVKKFSGASPKALSKNENDRFILLSTLP